MCTRKLGMRPKSTSASPLNILNIPCSHDPCIGPKLLARTQVSYKLVGNRHFLDQAAALHIQYDQVGTVGQVGHANIFGLLTASIATLAYG